MPAIVAGIGEQICLVLFIAEPVFDFHLSAAKTK